MLTKWVNLTYGRSMSRQVNLYEAKTQLSRLVDEAANGDTIVIAKDGKPMATLGPVSGARRKQPRKLGQLAEQAKGVDWIQWWRDWKAADKQIEAEFEAAAARPLPAARSKRRKR
jgi:antitoxin (DNA-binding transcriptional repressor) of toxin-antitoxin stability system